VHDIPTYGYMVYDTDIHIVIVEYTWYMHGLMQI